MKLFLAILCIFALSVQAATTPTKAVTQETASKAVTDNIVIPDGLSLTAPTATTGTNTSQVATTAFVQAAIAASGVQITNPSVAYVQSNGNDGTGTIGRPDKPYQTFQAAYNAEANVFVFGVGTFAGLTASGLDIMLIGQGVSKTIVGNISGTAGNIYGNGQDNITVGSISIQSANGPDGTQGNPATSIAPTNGSDGAMSPNVLVQGLTASGAIILQSGNGGQGAYGGDAVSGQTGNMGSNGGNGGAAGTLTVTNCNLNNNYAVSIAGSGGTGGQGSSYTDSSNLGGDGGNGGSGGTAGAVIVTNSIVGGFYAAGANGGGAGAGGTGFSGGNAGSAGSNGASGTIITYFTQSPTSVSNGETTNFVASYINGSWTSNPVWGQIGGTLANQADLQSALSLLLPSATAATTYQPLSDNLTTFAGIAPSANMKTFLGSSNYAAMNTALSLNNVENTALSTWAGTSNVTTLGTVTTGTWQASAIADTYISSAATWNAKQNALSFSTGGNGSADAGKVVEYLSGGGLGATGGMALSATSGGGYANWLTTGFVFGNVGGTSYSYTFNLTTPTASRTITFPDASGTVALTSTLSAYQATAGTLALAGFGSITGTLADANIASAATWNAKQSALTFSTGLTNTGGTVTVNASQYISTNSYLTTNGFVKTSGGTGALSVDTTSYQNTAGTLALAGFGSITGTLPVANGGTGTASPALVAGSNITITGTWPNQTIAASGGATLGANTFTALQTITQASTNTGIIASTGLSLTGSNASNMIDLAGTWNTSGAPSAIKLNITNTASSSSSKLIDLQVGGTSKFSVNVAGTVSLGGGQSTMLNIVGPYNTAALSQVGDGSLWLASNSLILPATGYLRFGYVDGSNPILTGGSSTLTLTNGKLVTAANLQAGTNGSSIKSIKRATGTLVAGTVTIADTDTTANSFIAVTVSSVRGTVGFLSVSVTAGTGYTITSSSILDTSSLVLQATHFN